MLSNSSGSSFMVNGSVQDDGSTSLGRRHRLDLELLPPLICCLGVSEPDPSGTHRATTTPGYAPSHPLSSCPSRRPVKMWCAASAVVGGGGWIGIGEGRLPSFKARVDFSGGVPVDRASMWVGGWALGRCECGKGSRTAQCLGPA